MSLDKSIQYGKEKRKPYKGAKAVSKQCRNHGGCEWCEDNRLHRNKKAQMRYTDNYYDEDGDFDY